MAIGDFPIGGLPIAGSPAAADTVDDLLANDVESLSQVSIPALGQVHVLNAADVQSVSSVSIPALGQIHAFAANDVESNTSVTIPAVGQIHALAANDVQSASELSQPVIGQIHALTANDVESASELSLPAAAQANVLLANDVESLTELTSPVLGQVHVLLATSVESASSLSKPVLVGDPVVVVQPDVYSYSPSKAAVDRMFKALYGVKKRKHRKITATKAEALAVELMNEMDQGPDLPPFDVSALTEAIRLLDMPVSVRNEPRIRSQVMQELFEIAERIRSDDEEIEDFALMLGLAA